MQPRITIHVTPVLRERVGKARSKSPTGISFRRGRHIVEVDFRPTHDQYNLYTRDRRWLASFADASDVGMPKFEEVQTAHNVRLIFPVANN